MRFLRLSLLVITTVILAACSTSAKKMFPTNGAAAMTEIFRGQGQRSGNAALLETRSILRRPLQAGDIGAAPQVYQGAPQSISPSFARLPSPDLVMYIYPHLVGSEGAPIPGYSTVFPLYQQVHYALPGERTQEDR